VEGLSRPYASGIIAEFKRKSPSKGVINDRVDLLEVTKGYQAAGASAVSILTDEYFFGGDDQDVVRAREVLDIPILRKEFIIDEYQVHEAKALGADFVSELTLMMGIPAALALSTAGELASTSQGLRIIASTFCDIKVSICCTCFSAVSCASVIINFIFFSLALASMASFTFTTNSACKLNMLTPITISFFCFRLQPDKTHITKNNSKLPSFIFFITLYFISNLIFSIK
jgi:hypothetical protein